MERIVNLHIEKLPECFYLATSDEVQGLIAQERTIQETIEIAQDVAKRLIEARETHHLENRLRGQPRLHHRRRQSIARSAQRQHDHPGLCL